MVRVAFVLLSAICGAVAIDSSLETFDGLIKTHGRDYVKGTAEYEARFEVFKKNADRIVLARARDPKAQYGWNKFFDLSAEEFARKYKMPVRNISTQPKSGADAVSCLGGGASVKSSKVEAIPDAFDWRTYKPEVVTPVKDQQQCGSCWAFSTTETVESAWVLAGNPQVILAPQEIVDCSNGCAQEPPYGSVCNQGCNGGWPWSAFADLIKFGGLEKESDYPYTGADGSCAFDRTKVAARIRNYTCVSGPNTADETVMASTLMRVGPMSIGVNAEWWQFYFGGLSQPSECDATQLDHAVQVVGFGTQKGWFGETEPFWIVRNSWNTDWGESGYIRMGRGMNSCGVANAVAYAVV